MIHSQVRFLENRCQFKLIRSTFIVTGFCRNAQPMALVFEFIPKSIYPFGNSPEIMIFQLLIFSCRMAPSKYGRTISGQAGALNKASSTRKYSCSHPKVAVTFSTSLSKYWQMPTAALSINAKAFNIGVL